MTISTGYIGLGAMGRGMAANLHGAGFLTSAWNRTRANAESFAAEHGIRLADSPEAVAAECDLIFTCVSADADLTEVVARILPQLRPGAVIVDCSTFSADTARTLAKKTGEAGGSFLDAPVSGGVEGANKGTLAMMVGGDAAALEKARPALEAVAARIVHMGASGAGQATKAVNQIMAAGINQAVSEALAFGTAQGLDMDKVIEVVSGGAAGNWFLEHRGPTMTHGRFDPGFKVALHHKDLGICRAMAGDVRLVSVEQTLTEYEQLMEQGHGEEDISALFRIKSAKFNQDA